MVQITQPQELRQRSHFPSAALSIGLLLALLSVALAACSPSLGGPPPPPTQPPVMHCGGVQSLGPHLVPADQAGAKQAEDCFWQAFQQCRPATFTFIMGGVDTVTTRIFTVQVDKVSSTGNCALSDTRQFRMLPNPPLASKTYTCMSMLEKPDGLHFSNCDADGDILVPVS